MAVQLKEQLNINVLLKKLKEMYSTEECLMSEINKLFCEYEQLKEDQELLELMIMHKSNKIERMKEYKKNVN